MDVQWSDWERNILDTFMDGEAILRLPARQMKRKVILKWLAAQVPPEIRIPHSEFNRLIQRHHPDSATIRREMFEFGYVHRDRDHYWRDATPLNPFV